MLGSSSVVLRYRRGSKSIRLGFSGDVGRKEMPIIRDPESLPPVDFLIMESTYGGRLHAPRTSVKDKLAKIISDTCRRGGHVVVPAFSVGRTQELALMLHELTLESKIPVIPIYVDSPLATNATEVYRRHPECYDNEIREHLEDDRDPFAFKRLRYTRNVGESKALNDVRYPYVVISASGMCEAGRILHHLRNSIEDPRNTVLITGYQAGHTLGRKIVEQQREVPIFGEPMRLRANVPKLNEMSGHADQQEPLNWLRPIASGLKRIFLVHGEPPAQASLAEAIEGLFDIEVVTPEYGKCCELTQLCRMEKPPSLCAS